MYCSFAPGSKTSHRLSVVRGIHSASVRYLPVQRAIAYLSALTYDVPYLLLHVVIIIIATMSRHAPSRATSQASQSRSDVRSSKQKRHASVYDAVAGRIFYVVKLPQ